MEALKEIISPELLVKAGYIVMSLVVFAETGLLAGFFLPGDSLLITAGVFVARGDFDFLTLNALLVLAAIVGDATGYFIGRRLGGVLLNKPDGRFFKKAYIEETQAFYEKHGGKTIVFARFVPIVRTFAPTLAGVSGMPYMRFASYNIIGGLFWVISMTSTGYMLALTFPQLTKYLELIIVFVIVLSVIPIAWKYFFSRKQTNQK